MLLYLIPYILLGLPALVFTGALALRLGIAVIYTPRGFSVAQNIIWSIANFIRSFSWFYCRFSCWPPWLRPGLVRC